MGINAKLRIGYGLSAFIVLATGVVLYFSFERLHRVNQTLTAVDSINISVFELNQFCIEFLWHHEARPVVQWHAQYEDIIRQLTTVETLQPRSRALIGKMRDHLSMARVFFTDMVALHQEPANKVHDELQAQVQNRLQSQLLLKLRRALSYSATLKTQLQTELIANQQNTGWLCMGLIFVSALSSIIIGVLTGRSISQPIRQLLFSTDAIGAGNFAYPIETGAQGEIGQLARSFEQMAKRLETTMVSRSGLEKVVDERTAVLKDTNRQLRLEITERKEAEEKLHEAETKYRTVADFTYDWEYWTDESGNFLYISPSCKNICGYDAQAFMNNAALMDEIILPDDKPGWSQHRQDARTAPGPQQAVFRIQRPDGEIRWIEHICQPVTDDAGNPLGVRASNRDITRRKKQEIEIKQSLEFEKLITELSREFINCSSEHIDDIIIGALERVGIYMKMDRAFIFRFNPDRRRFRISYLWESEYAPKDKVVQGELVQDLFPWLAAELIEGREIIVNNVQELLAAKALREYEYCRQIGIRSFCVFPVQLANMPLCAIGMDAIRLKSVWGDNQKAQLRIIGEVVANTIARIEDRQAIETAYREISTLKSQLEADSEYLQSEIAQEHNFENIIGNSDALKYVLYRVEQVAVTDATVMILGETGSGKELIARAIHSTGARGQRPLIKVNCASLPAGLIESELFGHEKGAFSGAVSQKKGRFELAHGSTLFLDEVGELPLELQAKLLRVLEGGEFERVGGTKTIQVDARIIAATNRNLQREVQTGDFREDLWYRLNVYSLTVPTLRERTEDIPLLVRHFVDHYSKRFGKAITKVTEGYIQDLVRQPWPGNVRELKHTIEKAIINAQRGILAIDSPTNPTEHSDRRRGEVNQSLAAMERDYILTVLSQVDWKVEGPGGAAEILQINPSTLRARMRKHGIKKGMLSK